MKGGVLVVLASSVTLASCDAAPPAPSAQASPTAQATAPAPRPVDRVEPGEIPEGTEKAFGFPLPRAMRVEARFPDEIRARGQLPFDAVANYVRARVVAERIETGPAKTVFPRATLKTSPDKMLRLEVIAFGDRTEIFVRDVTRPPASNAVKPTDPWYKPGFDPSDRKVDPKRFE